MSGFSSASGIIAARHGLDSAIRAALIDDRNVDITFGPAWPVDAECWVSQGRTLTDTDPATLGSSRQQQERITFFIEVGAWIAGKGDEVATAAFDRAFGLLRTIQDHIRVKDITLGGNVLWCVPGSTESDGVSDDDGSGYYAVIAASFVAIHRIRTGS